MNLIEYPDRATLMAELAGVMTDQLRALLAHQDHVSFAGAGGSTPGPVYDCMSGHTLNWDSVTILPGDERWVPESSPRSNAAQLKARLMQGPAREARFQPLFTGDATPEDGLKTLQAQVSRLLPLSVVLLGMGDDMHTASLFPGAVGLEEALADTAPPLAVIRAREAGEPRVSLTAPVLRNATHVNILITGAVKRTALEAAVALPQLQAPVRAVIDVATIHWAE
ncbi:MAG: 6-phosphogluconolactonase [Brevirhabdus sp.]